MPLVDRSVSLLANHKAQIKFPKPLGALAARCVLLGFLFSTQGAERTAFDEALEYLRKLIEKDPNAEVNLRIDFDAPAMFMITLSRHDPNVAAFTQRIVSRMASLDEIYPHPIG